MVGRGQRGAGGGCGHPEVNRVRRRGKTGKAGPVEGEGEEPELIGVEELGGSPRGLRRPMGEELGGDFGGEGRRRRRRRYGGGGVIPAERPEGLTKG